MHIKLLLYYWGRSIYVYVTKIQNIQNRNQYSTLDGLFINRKKIIPEGVAALMLTITTYPSNCDILEPT